MCGLPSIEYVCVCVIVQPYLGDLCAIITMSGVDALSVEVLGILGNLTLQDMDFHKLITEMELLPFLLLQLKVPVDYNLYLLVL